MKKITCSEVSGMTCDFEAMGETSEEVKAALNAHTMDSHSDEMAAMSDAEKMAMESKVDEMLAAQE